jgi:hypothetical protein
MSKRGTCWEGYEQKGMKKKGNKMVPNCVPAGMKKGGLKEWFRQNWVDIGSKRKDGSFAKCGRSKQRADAKRKYPKCVPLARARRMTESQRKSAVARKRVAANVGPKPTNVKTILKRDMGGDVKKIKPKGSLRLNLFEVSNIQVDPNLANLEKNIRMSKAKINPELNYNTIYKKGELDIGIRKDRLRIGFKKRF